VLFHHLLFGDRKFESEQKVREGIAVQDVFAVQNIALFFEVDPEIVRSISIVDLGPPVETTDLAVRIHQLFRGQMTDLVHQPQLGEYVQFVEFADTLLTEIQLKHAMQGLGGRFRAHG